MDAISVIIKPCSDSCNLRCTYCYHDWLKKNSKKRKSMSLQALAIITEKLGNLPQKKIRIIWHGGEPLLRGLLFFETAIKAQQKFPGKFINLIQTNGTLITGEWAKFFKVNHFNVGISIDGPQQINDLSRRTKKGESSFAAIIKGLELLHSEDVETGSISVVTEQSSQKASEIFDFLYRNKLLKMNFSPSVEDGKGSISTQAWSRFLLQIFKKWLQKDDKEVKIVPLESFVQGLMGGEPTVCYFKNNCSNFISIDSDGTTYICGRTLGIDYFKIGNLLHQSIPSMLLGDDFEKINKKAVSLPEDCLKCKWLSLCNGGCPLQRNQKGIYIFCEMIKTVLPQMEKTIKAFMKTQS